MLEDRLDEAPHLDHRAAMLVVGFGVEPRVPRDLAARLGVVVDAPEVIAVGHRRERAVERKNLEAVARQVQLADDLGAQQRDDVRTHGEPEAGEDLFRDGARRRARDGARARAPIGRPGPDTRQASSRCGRRR